MSGELSQLINGVAGGGVCAVLLVAFGYWFIARFLPRLFADHQATVERLCVSSERKTTVQAEALDRNTEAVKGLARAGLAQTLIGAGVDPEDAIRQAGAAVLNGSSPRV